jgi:threonyl-tRNA synthetase
MAEVQMFLKMLHEVYSIFGLDYSMALSTRPEGYLGELELWNKVGAGGPAALSAELPAEL